MSQIDTEIDKKHKIFQFSKQSFMHFLLKFHRLHGVECFKGSTMKKLVRPVVFNEEITAMFCLKMSQIDTENDKNPKSFQFSKISCIFSNFLTDFVNWNVEKGQQGK